MTDNEIRKALDDISEMKKSINGNLQLMRPILLDRTFIPFCYIAGIFFVGIFSSLHLLIAEAGSFASIEAPIKAAWIAFAILGAVVTSLFKTIIVTRILKKQRRSLTIFDLLFSQEFREIYLLLLYGIIIAIAGAAFVAARIGEPWVFMPVICALFSFYLAFLGYGFRVREYFILSFASLAVCVAMVFFMKGTELLWLGGYLGGISVVYGVMLQVAKDNR
jgi:hypothetical protein